MNSKEKPDVIADAKRVLQYADIYAIWARRKEESRAIIPDIAKFIAESERRGDKNAVPNAVYMGIFVKNILRRMMGGETVNVNVVQKAVDTIHRLLDVENIHLFWANDEKRSAEMMGMVAHAHFCLESEGVEEALEKSVFLAIFLPFYLEATDIEFWEKVSKDGEEGGADVAE